MKTDIFPQRRGNREWQSGSGEYQIWFTAWANRGANQAPA